MNDKLIIKKDFTKYVELFLSENSKLNLISKNDEKFLYEKHIYDSLSISLFFDKYGYNTKTLLDIGCGGGFPSVPIAIEYPDIRVTAIDSIRKKINSIELFKQGLNLQNLTPICDRVENIRNEYFDIITSRAVADLAKISEYALPRLNKDGFFIAYKSKKALEEIKNAKMILQKYNAEVVDIIEYTLPLDEIYERCLVIIKNKYA